MVTDILNNLTISVYGRSVNNSTNWRIAKTLGVNRLYYIHSGSAIFTSGHTRLELQPGFLYLFPQNIEFHVTMLPGQEIDHSFYNFYLGTFTANNVLRIDIQEDNLISKTAKILLEIAEHHSGFPEFTQNEYYTPAKLYLANLMFLLYKAYDDVTFVTEPRIKNALAYIYSNIGSPITIDDLAKMSFLEKNHFIRLFEKHMNISPHQYIKNYRLNLSISLIRSGCTITEAANAVGYKSLGTFTNTLKKHTGYTPSELRHIQTLY